MILLRFVRHFLYLSYLVTPYTSGLYTQLILLRYIRGPLVVITHFWIITWLYRSMQIMIYIQHDLYKMKASVVLGTHMRPGRVSIEVMHDFAMPTNELHCNVMAPFAVKFVKFKMSDFFSSGLRHHKIQFYSHHSVGRSDPWYNICIVIS